VERKKYYLALRNGDAEIAARLPTGRDTYPYYQFPRCDYYQNTLQHLVSTRFSWRGPLRIKEQDCLSFGGLFMLERRSCLAFSEWPIQYEA
jgi:hypothetical protein